MARRFRSLLIVLVLLLTAFFTGCKSTGTTGGSSAPTPTPIPAPVMAEKPTYTVRRGEVVDSLSFTGRIAPSVEEELFFRENGRVKKVYVERDDMVEVGTVLAELENDDLKRQIAQAEIEMDSARLNLSLSEQDRQYDVDRAKIDFNVKQLQTQKIENSLASVELDVRVAQLNLAQAKRPVSEEDLAIARSNVERAKNSLWSAQINRDATCGEDKEGRGCDSAQASVQSAEEGVRQAELSLQKTLKGPDAGEIAIQEARVQQAQQRLDQAKLDVQIQQEQFKLAEMELKKITEGVDSGLLKAVERAQLSLDRLNAQLANTVITSTITGKVTSVSAYDGRDVQAYRPVFIVANEAELEVTAEPMSSQLQRLQEGMQASLILSAYPGKELPAEIVQLPYPYGRGGGATVEEADTLTHITFDPQDLAVEPGDLVKVIVVLERKADALWLPPAAIRTFAGRQFVVVQEEGRQVRTDIIVGIESTERVEITDGLQEGQIVIGQ